MHTIGRRHFLAAAGLSLLTARPSFANVGARTLLFANIHTGEKLKVDYWVEGRYLPDALAAVNRVLRDFRSDEVYPIAPELLDLLSTLRGRLETSQPVSVISGYRSPGTNTMLRGEREQSGVATKSLHMKGMAVDIRIAGRSLKSVHVAALAQKGGGVGYYPTSDFVHVDVGRVRSW